MPMKRVFFLFFLLFARLDAVKYAADFLNLGFGARYLAMGGAGVAFAGGPSSLFFNPAGILRADKGLLFMHSSFFKGLHNVEHAAFSGFKVGYLKGGIAVSFLHSGNIEITELRDTTDSLSQDNPPRVIKKASFDVVVLRFGLSKSFGKTGTGLVLKMVYGNTYEASMFGFGFDLGFQKVLKKNLRAGVVIKDVTTTTLFWSTGNVETAYPHVVFGFAGGLKRVILAMDFDLRFEDYGRSALYSFSFISLEPQMGVEWSPREIMHLRAGFNHNNFTFGIGLDLKKLFVNYAFQSHGELGGTHLISLTYEGL